MIGRFDGTDYTSINPALTWPDYGNGVWDFATFSNNLYLGAAWSRLSTSSDGSAWSTVLGYSTYMWEIEPFQGYLYMSHDIGCLRRVDASGTPEMVWWLAPEPIISMIADGDNMLYLGTGGEAGYLYRYGDYAGQVYQFGGTGTPQAISGVLAEGVQCFALAEADSCRYYWLGFLPPLTSNGNGLFKRGSTIPVKFKISDLDGNPVSDCLATLEVFYWEQGAEDGLPQVVSYSNGDLGDTFRYDANNDNYIFNLSTKPWEYLGSMRYQIVVTLDDGQQFDICFSLK